MNKEQYKDKDFDIRFSGYGLELVLKNDDVLIFTLYYSNKYGVSLLAEDKPLEGDINPDEVINNINTEEIIKELFISEEGISTLDVTGTRKNLPINIKEVNVFDKDSPFPLAGSIIKYNREIANKYGLNELYAYDYFNINAKKNIRKRNF